MRSFLQLTVGFVLTLALGISLWGQVVGASLFGIVRDESGSAIPGATVIVKNLETGEQQVMAESEL